jgi:hypothetical protein
MGKVIQFPMKFNKGAVFYNYAFEYKGIKVPTPNLSNMSEEEIRFLYTEFSNQVEEAIAVAVREKMEKCSKKSFFSGLWQWRVK